ncbi:MAG: CsbD family protein [Sphingomonas bacterium]|nr:CsbD family protein [Sphingomonas bacterium]
MKRAPRSLQHHVLYRKYNGQDSEISALLGKCGMEGIGKATDNASLEAEGKAQKLKGSAQDVKGSVKGALGDNI